MKTQGSALVKLWDLIPHEDLYAVGGHVYRDGRGIVRFDQVKSVPPVFALQLGEIFYQLRATLDGAIYKAVAFQTRQDPPPDEQKLEFPICHSATEFAKKSAFMLGPLTNERRGLVEAIQPYHTPKLPPEKLVLDPCRAIAILHEWARIDRHRRLHVIGAWASARPLISCPHGVGVMSMKVIKSGFLKDKNILATFRLIGSKPGVTKIQVNPQLRLDIGLNEAPMPAAENDTLGNRLSVIADTVDLFVTAMENSF